jgi:TonB family protein
MANTEHRSSSDNQSFERRAVERATDHGPGGRREEIPTVDFPDIERDDAGIPTFVFRERLLEKDRPTPDQKTLEVTMLWRESTLSINHYEEARPVLVGDRVANDFRLAADTLPNDAFPLIDGSGTDFVVNFTDAMTVEVRRDDGEIYDLEGLRKKNQIGAVQIAGTRQNQYKLGVSDRVAVQVGAVTFVVQYVSPSRSKPVAPLKTVDFYFTKVLGLVLMAHLFTLVAISLTPLDPLGLSEDLFKNPNRFAKLILKEPDKAKKKEKKFDLKETKQDTKVSSFGKMKARDLRVSKDAPRVDPNKREKDREKVMSSGIFSALRGAGGGAAAKVFGPGGLGTGINNALQGLRGAEAGDAGGAGGLGTRGGPGGGGGSLGIGGLGDGSGFGSGGPGGGRVDLSGRGHGGYSVIPGRTITKGCLTQDQVGRVLNRAHNQAKYCYEKELTRNPNLSGKITTQFTIGPSGAVVDTRLSESTMNDKAVEDCLVRVIQRLRFPPCVGGGTAEVTYPWIFKSGAN